MRKGKISPFSFGVLAKSSVKPVNLLKTILKQPKPLKNGENSTPVLASEGHLRCTHKATGIAVTVRVYPRLISLQHTGTDEVTKEVEILHIFLQTCKLLPCFPPFLFFQVITLWLWLSYRMPNDTFPGRSSAQAHQTCIIDAIDDTLLELTGTRRPGFSRSRRSAPALYSSHDAASGIGGFSGGGGGRGNGGSSGRGKQRRQASAPA